MKKIIYVFITLTLPGMLAAQWQEIYSPAGVYFLNNMRFFSEETGVLLDDNGFIEMTMDGGLSWNKIAYPDQTASMADFFVFGTTTFVALSNPGSLNANIMVSHNSGILWEQVSPDLFWPEAMDFLNDEFGYCAAFGSENSIPGHSIYKLGGIGPYP